MHARRMRLSVIFSENRVSRFSASSFSDIAGAAVAASLAAARASPLLSKIIARNYCHASALDRLGRASAPLLDALVWAITSLSFGNKGEPRVRGL